jgi:hypothetical protein
VRGGAERGRSQPPAAGSTAGGVSERGRSRERLATPRTIEEPASQPPPMARRLAPLDRNTSSPARLRGAVETTAFDPRSFSKATRSRGILDKLPRSTDGVPLPRGAGVIGVRLTEPGTWTAGVLKQALEPLRLPRDARPTFPQKKLPPTTLLVALVVGHDGGRGFPKGGLHGLPGRRSESVGPGGAVEAVAVGGPREFGEETGIPVQRLYPVARAGFADAGHTGTRHIVAICDGPPASDTPWIAGDARTLAGEMAWDVPLSSSGDPKLKGAQWVDVRSAIHTRGGIPQFARQMLREVIQRLQASAAVQEVRTRQAPTVAPPRPVEGRGSSSSGDGGGSSGVASGRGGLGSSSSGSSSSSSTTAGPRRGANPPRGRPRTGSSQSGQPRARERSSRRPGSRRPR